VEASDKSPFERMIDTSVEGVTKKKMTKADVEEMLVAKLNELQDKKVDEEWIKVPEAVPKDAPKTEPSIIRSAFGSIASYFWPFSAHDNKDTYTDLNGNFWDFNEET